MSVDTVADAIRGDVQDEVLKRYFSPEYIDEEIVYDYTQSKLLEYGMHWRDALVLWRKYEQDFSIDKHAVAEYVAQTVPKEMVQEALSLAPDERLLRGYLYEEEKVDWCRNAAYAESGDRYIVVSARKDWLWITRGKKGGELRPSRKTIRMPNPEILGMEVGGDCMALIVESERGKQTLRLPIGDDTAGSAESCEKEDA